MLASNIVYRWDQTVEVRTRPRPRESHAERLYSAIKDMAIAYRIKPGERLNEVELARQLGGSRTPLREALNRLAAEGFLTFRRSQGFFCREFKPREIHELYQLRRIIELAAARLVCEQASDGELDELARFLDQTGPEQRNRTSADLVALDEQFHRSLMAMARNDEMMRVLDNINARIKFFRWVDMDTRRATTQGEHRDILAAIQAREPDLAAERMGQHITVRLDQITAAIKEGYSRIYLSGVGDELPQAVAGLDGEKLGSNG